MPCVPWHQSCLDGWDAAPVGGAARHEEMVMRALTAILLSLTSLSAFAGVAPPVGTVPEPGTLALLAAAGVAGFLIKRRGKK